MTNFNVCKATLLQEADTTFGKEMLSDLKPEPWHFVVLRANVPTLLPLILQCPQEKNKAKNLLQTWFHDFNSSCIIYTNNQKHVFCCWGNTHSRFKINLLETHTAHRCTKMPTAVIIVRACVCTPVNTSYKWATGQMIKWHEYSRFGNIVNSSAHKSLAQ